ncbi:MAG: histidine phosphatase family protein [Clostridiales bacterium]|nr:histidine phosphatase family protein [Clostridiales bacterium]
MKLILIRHGEPNYETDSLTPKGEAEAALLQERLRNIDVKKYYCSPLGRAKKTAEIALAGTGITPEILPWIREFNGHCNDPRDGHYRHCWDLLPKDWTSYPEMYDKDKWSTSPLYENTDVDYEYGIVKAGIDNFLKEYGYIHTGNYFTIEKSNDDTIVIFCHMAVSLLIIGYLTGIAAPLMWHGFFAAPTTFFEIQTEERADNIAYFRVRAMGDYSHLYKGGEPVSDSGFKLDKIK